jgi:pimeloyl-ACP methyl ester carboxylesterase
VLELETKLHGVVELQFADDVELYAWWKHLSKVHDRTLLLDAPADPRAQKFLPEHARPTVVGPRGGAACGDDDFASTMARRDGATWVVAQRAAKRVLERLTRPPRVAVEPDALGPRVFAYRAFGGAGPRGDVAPYYRTDARVPTRRGAAVAVATWAPVEKAAHRPTIVYCSGTNSSGRADAISSGALAVALELRAALVAFDFVGSGGSDDGVTSFGWWERYDVAAVVEHARREHPGSRVVVWGGASSGAVAALLCASRLDPSVEGLVLDSAPARLRDHVLEVLKDALKPDAPYREQLVQEIAGFVDERLKRRADFRLDDVDPAKECGNRLFKDKPVLVIGEHDAQGSVAASHAQELNGVLRGAAAGRARRRSADDGTVTTNHEILVVQGRTGPQRAAAAHVPAALAVIAGFLEKVFPRANPVAFAFFTRRAPHGIRDRLLARTPPWVTDDPELAKMSSHLQNVERAHAAKKAGAADAARKAGDAADGAPAAKPRHKKHHKPDEKKHAKAAADDGKKKHHHHHHQKETQ